MKYTKEDLRVLRAIFLRCCVNDEKYLDYYDSRMHNELKGVEDATDSFINWIESKEESKSFKSLFELLDII